MSGLTDHLKWFDDLRASPQYERFKERPIAYFCAEYALSERLPIYAGGLGVLAGDVVREAGDRGLPFVAVGLYYSKGYVCDTDEHGGKPAGVCAAVDSAASGLVPVPDGQKGQLTVQVPIQDRDVAVRVWRWGGGQVPVFLLDTDVEGNSPSDRMITERLYVGEKETRLKQEVVLGIGGLRALEAMDIHPSVYHLNEGHSAMLALELIRHEMAERQLGFSEAQQFARRRIVLTNHTLVAAGNELYSNDLVSMVLSRLAHELLVPVSELVKLGLVQQSSTFSMTMLAFRMSTIINSVSRIHARTAKEIWTDHPMAAITNGIHLPTWDKVASAAGTGASFWERHLELKRALLKELREKAGRDWKENELLIGWARRIVCYKRPMAILEDAARFAELARNRERPVRIVFAGRPHPSDKDGQQVRDAIKGLTEGDLKDVAVYLPDYDLRLAGLLIGGCDVWLNTPTVGFEACGTSGMKAALNGVLPCSTDDGWVAEAETEVKESGWILEDAKVGRSALDALQNGIAPKYYARNSRGLPEEWVTLMLRARTMVLDKFSASRMLREYVEMLYS